MESIEQAIAILEQNGVSLKLEGNFFLINGQTVSNPTPIIGPKLRVLGIKNVSATDIINYLKYKDQW
jgi:hypothetical protein